MQVFLCRFRRKTETTDKQTKRKTHIRLPFFSPRKLLFAFWTLHNNVVSNFDFDIIFETESHEIPEIHIQWSLVMTY